MGWRRPNGEIWSWDRMVGDSTIQDVAVVGTGVVGRSWIYVFARAGCRTRVYDRDRAQVSRALGWLEKELPRDREAGLRERVSAHGDLAGAVRGAAYVQESGPEDLSVKHAVFVELERVAVPSAILASSTSALDMTEIAAGLASAGRCVVAHPVNPPHVVPVVEVLGGERTDPDVVERARVFLASVGQRPVVVRRYVRGFLLNRLQAALVREALSLVERGVADVDAVDAVIHEGLGLRWALMGPFGVGNTNADGGIREYLTRYGAAFTALMNDLGETPAITPDLIERVGRETDAAYRAAPADFASWRDRLITKIRELKAEQPRPR